MSTGKHLWILFIVFIISLIFWYIPFAWIILYPFKLFATFIHEFGHAIVAVLTGAHVSDLRIFLDGSGYTKYAGGIHLLIIPSGYLTSTIIGAILLMIAFGESEKIAKGTLLAINLIMVLSIIFFIRDFLTIIILILFICGVSYVVIKASNKICSYLLGFLAMQCCFYSLYNINVLFNLSLKSCCCTDAVMMQNITFIPAPIWAILWALISFVVFGFVMKLIYSNQ